VQAPRTGRKCADRVPGRGRHPSRRSGAALAKALDDELAVNTLTLAEVLVAPARDGRLEAVRAGLAELEVRELPFPADAAVRLAHLRAQTKLKMPDCWVLLAAQDAGAQLASFDERLLQIAGASNVRTLRRYE